MRILAMADLHGIPSVFEAIPRFAAEHRADAIVLAGDLLRVIEGAGGREEGFRACGRELDRVLRRAGLPVLFVMGNDDLMEWEPDLPDACQLHGRRVDMGRWNFVGYAPTTPFVGGPFEKPDQEMEEDLRALASLVDGNTVLVTHGPVRGVLDDTPIGPAGSRSLLDMVTRHPPRLHVHGHIHSAFGRSGIHLNVASGGEERGMVIDLETLGHRVVGGGGLPHPAG